MKRRDITRLFLLPAGILLGWPFLLVLWALRLVERPVWGSRPPPEPDGTRSPWWAVLCAVRTERWTWPDKKWSWALGPAVIWSRITEETNIAEVSAHEYTHVRQAEDFAILGFVWGLLVCCLTPWFSGAPILGLALWLLMPAGTFVFNVASWMRGHGLYEGAQHERSARAQSARAEWKTWQERTGQAP